VDLFKLSSKGTVGPAAGAAAVRAAQSALGRIPHALGDLWSRCDGFLLDDGPKLYSTGEIVERNQTYEVEPNARGYLLVGDDSGGRAFLMSREGSSAVFSCDMGFLDADYFTHVANDLLLWVASGCVADKT
jgi:hypothetical protein